MKRNTVLKWTLLIALMAYAGFMTVWAHHEAARHVCTGIEIHVDGNKAMDSVIRRGVKQRIAGFPEKIVGCPLNAVDTRMIERRLSRVSNFESVDCSVTSEGKLRVDIVPLVPVMRVFGTGKSYYINKEGKHIESKAEFFTDVPVVRGNFSREFTPTEVIPLVNHIASDPMLRELSSMIVARDRHNLMIVPRIYGHIINFGDTTRLQEKTRALALFYRKVMPYKGWQEYDTISVKFRGQVVATRRDKTIATHGPELTEDVDLEELSLPDAPQPQENQQKNQKENPKNHKNPEQGI